MHARFASAAGGFQAKLGVATRTPTPSGFVLSRTFIYDERLHWKALSIALPKEFCTSKRHILFLKPKKRPHISFGPSGKYCFCGLFPFAACNARK